MSAGVGNTSPILPESTTRLEVFFDYTCGFSNRARRWLDALGQVVAVWRPFSLMEQRRDDDGPTVFERGEHADNVSLIALAVHQAVRAGGGDVGFYRNRMFDAWHEQPGRLSTDDIVGFGHAAGLGSFDREAAFASLAAEHARARALGVFGTPTLLIAGQDAVFVKLDAVPNADQARLLWESLRRLPVEAPALREWQRVTAPEPGR